MGALRDAVEDALGAEDIGGRGIDGGGEVSIPFAVGSDAAEIILLDLHLLGDLGLLLGGWLGELLFDRELNSYLRILGTGNRKRLAELQRSF